MSRLLRFVVPAGLIGAIAMIPIVAKFSGAGGEQAWILWPGIVALLLLAASGAAAFFQQWRWLAAPLAGFVFQAGAILWMAVAAEKDAKAGWPGTILGTFLVILLALFVIALHWAWSTHRSGSLEKYLVKGMGEGAAPGGDPRDIQRIQQNMMDALATLRRAGKGRNAIYELPWFLVFGRPAAGKTVAIKQSGLGLPVRKDWVKGTGGTYTADWFFTNEMIFVDTPGRWVMEGADEKGRAFWRKLLQLLLKFRGRRPLDGLIVVVPSEDLLGLSDEELEDQASRVRDVIDLIHAELRFQFPVYVLVSKCDLVDGFVDFFHALPPQRRHEILGWSNEDPLEPDVGDLVNDGFERVQRRLEAYRLEMVARAASRQRARRLFMFTEEFAYLRQPLKTFCETLFAQDTYRPTPFFRGFYFCSGTQGEGSPMSRAVSRFSEAMGVKVPAAGPASDEPKRSFFLLDLFRELMVQDKGLVKRSAIHWIKQHRDTKLGAFLPAVFFGTLFLFVALAFGLNVSRYADAKREVSEVVTRAGEQAWTGRLDARPKYDDYRAMLDRARKIREWQRNKLDPKYNVLRWFGTDRHEVVSDASREAWTATWRHGILAPMLGTAEALLQEQLDEDEPWTARACSEQLDMMEPILALRLLEGSILPPEQRKRKGSDVDQESTRKLELSLALLFGDMKTADRDKLLTDFEREFAYVSGAQTSDKQKASELLVACHETLGRIAQAVADHCDDFCTGTRYHELATTVLEPGSPCSKLPFASAVQLPPDKQCAQIACREALLAVAAESQRRPWLSAKDVESLAGDIANVNEMAGKVSGKLRRPDGGQDPHELEREAFEPVIAALKDLTAPRKDDWEHLQAFDKVAAKALLAALDDSALRECRASGVEPLRCLVEAEQRATEQRPALAAALEDLRKAPDGLEAIHDVPWDDRKFADLVTRVAAWHASGPKCLENVPPPPPQSCDDFYPHQHAREMEHCHKHPCTDAQGRVLLGPDGRGLKYAHRHGHIHPHDHDGPGPADQCAGGTPGGDTGPRPPRRPENREPREPGEPTIPTPPARQSALTYFELNTPAAAKYGATAWQKTLEGWSKALDTTAGVESPTATALRNKTLVEARTEAARFRDAWLAHVDGLRLAPVQQAGLNDWLQSGALIQAEFDEKILQPLDDALKAAEPPGQDPDLPEILGPAVEKVSARRDKLNDLVSTWVQDLDEVSKGLSDLNGQGEKISTFQDELAAGRSSNPVVKLRNTVKRYGIILRDRGASFAAPLAGVEELLAGMQQGIRHGNVSNQRQEIAKAWEKVKADWQAHLEERFPFGDREARQPAKAAGVAKVLGQGQGSLRRFVELTEGVTGIDSRVVQWARDATEIGRDLFGEDGDALLAPTVVLSIDGSPSSDAAPAVTVTGINVFAAGGEYAWSRSRTQAGTLTFDMLSTSALDTPSSVTMQVTVEPGSLKDYTDRPKLGITGELTAARATEDASAPWSMLKLFRRANTAAIDFKRPITKSFTARWSAPNGRVVDLGFTLEINARDLVPYARLLDSSLQAPPSVTIDPARLELPGE